MKNFNAVVFDISKTKKSETAKYELGLDQLLSAKNWAEFIPNLQTSHEIAYIFGTESPNWKI